MTTEGNHVVRKDADGIWHPVQPVDAFVEACLAEADARGIDIVDSDLFTESGKPKPFPAPVELSAAERIAEHTGHGEWLKVEVINSYLTSRGKPLTSGEQAYLAHVISTPTGP